MAERHDNDDHFRLELRWFLLGVVTVLTLTGAITIAVMLITGLQRLCR